MSKEKIRPREELASICSALKRGGYTLISTNGVFDILHLGHVQILDLAKGLGNFLLVGINSDSSAKQLNKGPHRPLMDENSRAMIVASLEMVDYVTIFPESTPIELLEIVKPTIHVKGGDYKLEDLPEREVVERHGGRIEIIPFQTDISTSQIINKAYDAHLSTLVQKMEKAWDKLPKDFLSPNPTKMRRFHMPESDDIELKRIEIPYDYEKKDRSLRPGLRSIDTLRPKIDTLRPKNEWGYESNEIKPETPTGPHGTQTFIIGSLDQIDPKFRKEIELLIEHHKSEGASFPDIAGIVMDELKAARVTINHEDDLYLITKLWTETDPSNPQDVIKFKAEKVENG